MFARNDGKDADVFDQDWETYQNGFGNLNSNFWWGNEFLHLVTKDTPHELKVDLVKPGATDFTRCFQFQVKFSHYFGLKKFLVLLMSISLIC